MFRKIEKMIQEWLVNSDKAFLLTGARQTGKTWIIRHALKNSGYNFYEINFIESPELISTFGENVSSKNFMLRLQALLPAGYTAKNTIIFFDEIQQLPGIVTRIKFLVDEGSYRYIMSGSLLGVTLKNIASAPVGYLTVEKLYPLDFEEFMIANGISESVRSEIENAFRGRTAVDEFIHERMVELFYIYLIVGGMPEAVQAYLDTGDIRAIDRVHRDIHTLYKADFTKYEQEDKKLRLISIYDIIPSELNKQNKRFVFTYLNKEVKFDRYENSFLWLKDAGVALPVYNAQVPNPPLISSKSSNLFKLFSSDVGMLTSEYSSDVRMSILQHDGGVNNGALFENAVAQQMAANLLEPFFYKKVKVGEVDFLTEIDGRVLPIEVKSGKNIHAHKALDNLLAISEFKLNEAVVLSTENVHTDGAITYLPIYMTYLIKNKEIKDIKISLDLSALQ